MHLTIKTEEEYERACRHLADVWKRERGKAGISLEALPYVEPIRPGQLGKLQGLLYTLSLESGNEVAYLQTHFEQTYGPRELELPKSMEHYSKDEASAMIERVIQVAAEQGYSLR